MTLSINDFTSATAYPCGKKKECQALLKEIPELMNVKEYSVKELLKENCAKTSKKTRGNSHE